MGEMVRLDNYPSCRERIIVHKKWYAIHCVRREWMNFNN